ncbi:MAG: hypothetical protein MUE95_02080 [Cyclobacteriaceae bacterium]|jgi:hypothetical protein|nr:hypothetical protein [Cyclobacteriaceae bacterium]
MRVIGEIAHPQCKITLFSWNNRYLIKLEKGLLEQTFKINQYDLAAEEELRQVVNESFISQAMTRFDDMERDLQVALQAL